MAGTSFVVEEVEGPERGLRVTCTEHDESAVFDPGQRRVTFYCPGCGYELEAALHAEDWRDLGEMC